MNTLLSVLKDFSRFFSFKTKAGRIKLAILLLVLIAGFVLLGGNGDDASPKVKQTRAVSVASVSSFSDLITTNLVGTVSSIDQASIRSELAGRVTSIPTSLGQTVSAGQVIATLESQSEYASLLQAHGVHEAALASAKSSDISLEEANLSLRNTADSALSVYNSTKFTLIDIFSNDLDVIFADFENTYRTPGVSLRATRQIINDIDRSFKNIGNQFNNWPERTSVSDADLEEIQKNINEMLELTSTFQKLIINDEIDDVYSATESSYLVTLSSIQTILNISYTSVQNLRIKMESAQNVVNKATVTGTSGEVSLANAQVKQALGTLKAAEANYNKTILRSPISGVVNSLDVKLGDFVTSFQTIAEIANNQALEITTFVGQSDRELITLQQEVIIEGGIKGIVSNIAPAVNSATGKIEVKVQSTSADLVNGDTVTITLKNDSTQDQGQTSLMQVPLSAVKFTANAGIVFTILDGALVTNTVEIGAVRNTFIEITSGLTADSNIVVDARGLRDGQQVTTIIN